MSGSHTATRTDSMLLDSAQAPGGVIVYYADGDEEIIHVNNYLVEMLECESLDEFFELTQGTFRGFVYEKDLGTVEDSIWGQVRENGSFDHVYYRVKTKSGRLINVEEYGRLAEGQGPRQVFNALVVEVKKEGAIDWLTGLSGAERFNVLLRMGAQTAEERGEQLAVAAFDIMGLKGYNEHHGRSCGNELLLLIADLLRKYFGAEACARFAEDHFYAFAPEAELGNKVEALFAELASVRQIPTLPVRAGAYVCVPGDDVSSVAIDRARIACDLDKKTWRSHLTWFDEGMRISANLRVFVLEHVDEAIEQGCINPYYQAIVRSATGDLCGEEALARWEHPEYGTLASDQFVPVLEGAGLLHKVDMHMIDCVISDMRTKQAAGMPVVPVSVNLSRQDLEILSVADEVASRADAAGIDRSLIRIEFTESVALDNPSLFKEQLDALHRAGFEVWMDDFGSGYSSLNMLQEFDFDLIKLDMGLIRYSENEKSRRMIGGIIQTAEKLGVGTLAEGVETEEQALFLESVGCGMLQGFLYSKPLALDMVIQHFKDNIGIPREPLDEVHYWDAISKIDLYSLSMSGGGRVFENESVSNLPAGVLELRGGVWRFVRFNEPYREFLIDVGFLSPGSSSLKAHAAEIDLDQEFLDAVDRCKVSGRWEQIASRLEYGKGMHFHVKPVVSTEKADAYLVATAPTTFGTALGVYGDLPIAYAVLRVIFDGRGEKAVNANYVYANSVYCEWVGFEQENSIGRSFLDTGRAASDMWLPFFYRAAALGENVHDVVFSPEAGHWLSFHLAPSPIKDCCVFAFAIVDDELHEREEIIADRDTLELIVDIIREIDVEDNFDIAINRVLETLGRLTSSEYVTLFERGENATRISFSWWDEGVSPRDDVGESFDNSNFDVWAKLFAGQTASLFFDMQNIEEVNPGLRADLEQRGIERLMSTPIFESGKLIGFVVLENCSIDERLDVGRVLETAAVFIGTRIANHRLLGGLEYASTHDALTGLLNRFGADLAIDRLRAASPDMPFALALLDVDNFKTMNDLYGHAVGDTALRRLADVMASSFPSDAILARNGGDEFLVMLPNVSPEHAAELYREFTEKGLSFERKGERYRFTTSLGFSCWPEQALTLEGIYTRADNALYSVKLTGKSGCLKYSSELKTQYRSQLGFTPRDIAENVPGAILVHKAGGDGKILFVNDEMIELFECESLADFMEYTGGTFKGVPHPEDAVHVYEEAVRQVSLDDVGAKNYIDYRIIAKTGKVKHVADNGRLVEIEGVGKVFYVLMVDVDERTRA